MRISDWSSDVCSSDLLLRLDGDHECGFTIEGQSGPALIAKTNVGDDQLASGAYKIGGQVLRVAGSGGFKVLKKGMELSGPGMKLAVVRVEDGYKDAAKMIAARNYAGERRFDGERDGDDCGGLAASQIN